MEIKKTVGHPKLDFYINGKKRKGYVIHTTCGEKYHAKPVGSQSFECGGINFESLKALKAAIVAGDFAEDATEASVVSTADGADTWDCVHPCAWLCIVTTGCKETLETLGNYGWLDVMGRPDIARAEREIKRVENLKKSPE